MAETVTKEISKEAGFLLHTINRGSIDLNRLKGFLAKVESIQPPSARSQKRRELLAHVSKMMK